MKGPPSDPDLLFKVSQNLGVFFVFIGFWICTVSWGWVLGEYLGLDQLTNLNSLAISLGIGTAALSILATALGLLGLIGYWMSPLHEALLFAGPFAFAIRLNKKAAHRLPRLTFQWREWDLGYVITFVFILITFISITFVAGLIHGTTDPHLYHLLGPRVWSENGAFSLHEGWPIIFTAASWENLFLYGNTILGGPMGKGLIEGQLFGQWTHFLLGLMGTIAALVSFLKIWIKDSTTRLLAAIVAVSNIEFLYWSWLAKNDFGILSWCFLAFSILFNFEELNSRRVAIAGVLLGLAISGKCTIVISLIPLLIVWSCLVVGQNRHAILQAFFKVFRLGGWIIAGAFPIYFRNWIFTGNPVFPMLDFFFKSPLISVSIREDESTFIAHRYFSIQELWHRIQLHLNTDYLYYGAVFLPILLFVYRKRAPFYWLALSSFFTLLFYDYWNIYDSFLRWIALSLLILSAAGTATLFDLIQALSSQIPSKFPVQKIARVILVLCLLFYVKQDVWSYINSWNPYFNGTSPTYVIRKHDIIFGGDARAWLRLNAKPEDLILTTGDTQYYLDYYLRIYAIQQHPLIDQKLRPIYNPDSALRVLKSIGAKYILDIAHWESRYYNFRGIVIDWLAQQNPQALVYVGPNSWIMDMDKIELPESAVPDTLNSLEPPIY